ncbi:MAG: nucleotidyltransferase family protein [Anaerolineales bacterium]|nr:nucleotidyltransferase family protein [Anaerolineales bacterium]
MITNYQEMLAEMRRVIAAGGKRDIQIRALGGLAVQLHNRSGHPLFLREYADLDFFIAKKQRRQFEVFMSQLGYRPDKRFNVLNGETRQIYLHESSGLKADVFVGRFEMCHKIPLKKRFAAHPLTLPLAELFLSKTQIVELNRKDALDIVSILLNNEVAANDNAINLDVLTRLCRADWGLYKTTSLNLDRVEKMLREEQIGLSADERELVIQRLDTIRRAFDEMPKPLAWQLRDKVGERLKWYMDVEEVRQ